MSSCKGRKRNRRVSIIVFNAFYLYEPNKIITIREISQVAPDLILPGLLHYVRKERDLSQKKKENHAQDLIIIKFTSPKRSYG